MNMPITQPPGQKKQGWIAVDFDGTLAHYDGVWKGPKVLGEPIWPMVNRVRGWLREGKDVRIFTARANEIPGLEEETKINIQAINEWCVKYFGKSLPVTATKDYLMIELWDDRAIQVMCNTGITLQEHFVKQANEAFALYG